jgi:hypothetical protein
LNVAISYLTIDLIARVPCSWDIAELYSPGIVSLHH